MADVSVGKLFLAGIISGFVMAVLMMATVSYYAWKYKWGGDIAFEWGRVGKAIGELGIVLGFPLAIWEAIRLGVSFDIAVGAGLVLLLAADRKFRFEAVLPILTPVILIGGMTTGIFTPTEGAIAASVWSLFLGLVWYRTLSWKMLVKVSMETIETTVSVMFIVAAASIFGWLLDGDQGHRCLHCLGLVIYAQPMGFSDARQPADAVRRLLSRADWRRL